jgi:hypothetical protein
MQYWDIFMQFLGFLHIFLCKHFKIVLVLTLPPHPRNMSGFMHVTLFRERYVKGKVVPVLK